MADDSSDEKSEAPSAKKKQDAREKGNVSKSTEINSVVVLLASIFVLKLLSPWIFGKMKMFSIDCFHRISSYSMSDAETLHLFYFSLKEMMLMMLPVILTIMIFGILANIFQIGFLFTTEPLTPKLERINPLSGFMRLMAFRSIVETVKSIGKLFIVGFVTYSVMQKEYTNIIMLGNTSIGTILVFTMELAFTIAFKVCIILVIIAIIDLLFQRFEHEKKLRMSHQDLKDERKQMDGDPMIKSRIRSLQREMARRRMMQEVPKATVVVTNPTHLAIAIRYDAVEMDTPVVVAKGKMNIAEKIKKIARENNVPVIEDKPLARAMYDKVVVGDKIPIEFFNAIAEILAYIYKLKNNKRVAA